MALPLNPNNGDKATDKGQDYTYDGTRWARSAPVVPVGPAKLLADGSVPMDAGWAPVKPQDVPTRDYVDQALANMPQPVLQSEVNQMVGVAGLDATGKLDPSVLPDEVQTTDEKNQPSGYAGLDVNNKIDAAQLPAAWAIPRLVFASQAAMLADGTNHKKGDLILVEGDPVKANNGEFVALKDAPTAITDYTNMGSTVGVHRHTGGDVDVQLAGQTQDFQYFVDNFLGANAPVGAIALWPMSAPPTGWLLCNGAVFDRQRYPELARVLGDTHTPQLENVFVRGASGTRRPMSQEGQSTARPHRSFAGAVSNRRTSGYVDSGRVNVSRGTVPCKSWGIAAKWTGGDDVTVSAALTFGHAKSWSVNGQSGNLANRHVTGSLNDGGVIVNAGGDPETRPANTALWYIIKAHAEQHLPGGIVPIRYEGVATANQQLVTLNERGNQQLIVVVNGAVLPESAYTVRNDKVTITQPMTAGDKYSIINYAKGAADPHHVYHTQADMVADGANIKQGELCFVHGDADAKKNGEYIPEIDTPAAIADFEHLGLHVSQHTHALADLRGVLASDGSIPLDTGWAPTNVQDIATKGYVDTHAGAGAIIHHGTTPPDDALGKNGDVYYEYATGAAINWLVDIPSTNPPDAVANMALTLGGGNKVTTDGTVTGTTFGVGFDVQLTTGLTVTIGFLMANTGGKEYMWLSPKDVNQANWEATEKINVLTINGQPATQVGKFSWADKATCIAPVMFEVTPAQKGTALLDRDGHIQIAAASAAAAAGGGEYDVYEKVGGKWVEHKPITTDGKVEFKAGYTPTNPTSAATKGYVDGLIAANAPKAPAIFMGPRDCPTGNPNDVAGLVGVDQGDHLVTDKAVWFWSKLAVKSAWYGEPEATGVTVVAVLDAAHLATTRDDGSPLQDGDVTVTLVDHLAHIYKAGAWTATANKYSAPGWAKEYDLAQPKGFATKQYVDDLVPHERIEQGVDFTPQTGAEYPVPHEANEMFRIVGLAAPYTFVAGDLAGKTIANGQAILYDAANKATIMAKTAVAGQVHQTEWEMFKRDNGMAFTPAIPTIYLKRKAGTLLQLATSLPDFNAALAGGAARVHLKWDDAAGPVGGVQAIADGDTVEVEGQNVGMGMNGKLLRQWIGTHGGVEIHANIFGAGLIMSPYFVDKNVRVTGAIPELGTAFNAKPNSLYVLNGVLTFRDQDSVDRAVTLA